MKHLVLYPPALLGAMLAPALNSYRRHRGLIRMQRGLRAYLGSIQ